MIPDKNNSDVMEEEALVQKDAKKIQVNNEQVQETQIENTNDLLLSNPNAKTQLSEEFKCGICLSIIHKCVTAMPCLHNYCGGCFSLLLKNTKNCPTCKKTIEEAKHNPMINNLIDVFLKCNSEFQRDDDELEHLEKHNIFKDGQMHSFKPNQQQNQRPQGVFN